jgi:Na+-transporting methylmalonyl-CoA/oxaloacetate decarboxylase gamma subunit
MNEETEMIMLQKENGGVRITLLFVFLFLFTLVHIGGKLIPQYFDYETLKDEMTTKARFAKMSKDEEIVAAIVNKAKDMSIPLTPDDVKVRRDETNHRMRISTAWDVELHFFYDLYPRYTVRTFHFEPIVDEFFLE